MGRFCLFWWIEASHIASRDTHNTSIEVSWKNERICETKCDRDVTWFLEWQWSRHYMFVYLAVWSGISVVTNWWFLRVKQVDIALLFCLEGVTELKWWEMSSSTLISHTNTRAVCGRPTLKRCWALSEWVGARTQRNSKRYPMIPNGRMDRLSTKQNRKQLLHFRTSCGKCSDFSDCCVNLYSFLYIIV